MANIKQTKIAVGNGSTSSKAKVTVTTLIEFTQADQGSWKYSIKLFGDDRQEGGNILHIFTFRWGTFQSRDYKLLNAAAGEMTVTDTREVDWVTLDEDEGTVQGIPKKDEVFARVVLAREAESNQWTSFGA